MKPENIEKQIREMNFRAGEDLHKKILDDALKAQQQSKQTNSAPTGPSIGRIIMKSPVTKLAAAAVIIAAIIICSHFFGGSVDVATNVWAEVIKQLEKLPDGMHRERAVFKCEGKEIDFLKSNGMKYFSSRFGVREDMYNKDGSIMMKAYFLKQEGVKVLVFPMLKQYKIEPLDTGIFDMFDKGLKYMVEQIKTGGYKELGRKNIDGKTVEGIEFTSSGILAEIMPVKVDSFVMRGWFDIETYLPVLGEGHFTITDKLVTIFTGGKEVEAELIADQYQWNVKFDASFFEPNIPADYNSISVTR
jgi:hypothetical protein